MFNTLYINGNNQPNKTFQYLCINEVRVACSLPETQAAIKQYRVLNLVPVSFEPFSFSYCSSVLLVVLSGLLLSV